ncbi:biopolymer transporter ExbD [Herbaspirillum rubrisubalbicans]|uniref:Biopolymer transporter ExbD n=2 Tax=Herbaspirillum rubrisubalbicans TaxID=80842 RepID=A0ABX9C5U9_9BURK|nr:biopolymer transporter ExbD [Herbaspirillum rubrisubalbicans]MCP1575993.1 biopolymer transport protein ExbD [Herbaspirillum rubrisubalbicans]NQE48745.1 biopolymer transporter ExbD [Herbaspirillum rubrisubalbicans]QJP99262.1 biopolymer transporter ExbD [Herbaspirillum rubrisubalbicans Os34]RAM65597.1 biopolymer transporter ExbD [Herbaspirillum rubrisubalbicans]RAN46162.1 biopolymer transporter ExbD [Herbaspirillum rubrisubalbicans]
MSFGGFNDNQNSAPMADINVTPMVDVMLVLLVIFIITAPMFTHALKLDLPTAQSSPAPEKPETITLGIDAAGKLYWNDQPVSQAEMDTRLAAAAEKKPQPELQLRADKSTRYQTIAELMSAAQGAGLTKLGFVTDPKASSKAPAQAN